MLKSNDVEFLASILNSLICRRPFFLDIGQKGTSLPLRDILALVPAHRWLLVAGAAPRWVKRLASQPRELPSDDKEELARALVSTFEEERMGRRPVQFVYFGADREVYEKILKPLKLGWIAVCEDAEGLMKDGAKGQDYYVRESDDGVRAFHVGPEPADMIFETRFLERAVGRRKTCVAFLVQKKLAELSLAATAIMNELEETHGVFTLVDLEELFELDGLTLEKEFDLVVAERDLDLRRYVTMPSGEETATLDKIARVSGVAAVAAVQNSQVMSLRRLTHTEVPVSRLAALLGELLERFPREVGLGDCYHFKMTCSQGEHVVAVKHNDCVYVVLFNPGAKLALGTAELLELLGGAART